MKNNHKILISLLTLFLALSANVFVKGYNHLLREQITHTHALIGVVERQIELLSVDYGSEIEHVSVCSTSTFKSWMPYQAITYRNSKQWELQQIAYTEFTYGIRKIDDYFMVAVTSQYGNVGDVLEIEFEEVTIYAIVGDQKDSGHDDCQSLRDGSVVEFIVDNNMLHGDIRKSGNLNSIFTGMITKINNLGEFEKGI